MTTDRASADLQTGGALPTTAGGLLRRARQAQGLHIAALAAAIKVPPAKLEALEADQFEKLPDATFTRALAQTVCRTLKLDPQPVLALLPPPNGHRLEEVAEGLKMPFNERPGRLTPGLVKLNGATLGVAGVLVAGAVVLYLLPSGWMAPGGASRSTAASEPDVAGTTVEPVPPGAEPAASEPALATAPPAATPAASTPAEPAATAASMAAAPLRFVASEAAWIGVTDATGKSLIGRLVQPGETVDIDGALPLALRVGNANRVRLSVRGEPTDLAKFTRDNVARLQVK